MLLRVAPATREKGGWHQLEQGTRLCQSKQPHVLVAKPPVHALEATFVLLMLRGRGRSRAQDRGAPRMQDSVNPANPEQKSSL